MKCFMFPGQPMALVNIPVEDAAFNAKARLCQEVSGFNPNDGALSDTLLADSIRLQLFGTTMSLYRYDLLIHQHGLPEMLAEHSMGIYPALAACGSIDSTTALELTCRFGGCLASMGTRGNYAFGSVVGLTGDHVKSIANNNNVYIANYNTSRHFLLSGVSNKIEAATIEADAAGAFSVGVFTSAAPLHTPLVEEIAPDLKMILSDYSFCEPSISLIDHFGQRRLKAADIPIFLVEELSRPVFWEKTYHSLRSEGVTQFYEVGAGMALTKFNRWVDSEL